MTIKMTFDEAAFNNIPPPKICRSKIKHDKSEHPSSLFLQRIFLFYAVCRLNDVHQASTILVKFDEVVVDGTIKIRFSDFSYESDDACSSMATFFTRLMKAHSSLLNPEDIASYSVSGQGSGQQILTLSDLDVVGVKYKKSHLKSFVTVIRKQVMITDPTSIKHVNEEIRREWKTQLFWYMINNTEPNLKLGIRSDPFNFTIVFVEPWINHIIKNDCTVPSFPV